jgi:hypothetical protein
MAAPRSGVSDDLVITVDRVAFLTTPRHGPRIAERQGTEPARPNYVIPPRAAKASPDISSQPSVGARSAARREGIAC